MKRVFLIVAFLSLLIMSSCKDAPTEPSVHQTYSLISGVPLPNIDGLGEVQNLFGTFLIKQNLGRNTSSELAFTQFETLGLDAGTVDVNDFNLRKKQSGSLFYYTSDNDFDPLPNIKFDGSDHIFHTGGSIEVPETETRVKSPLNFNLEQPEWLGTYDKSDGLDIEWTDGSSNSDERVFISISSRADPYSQPFITKDVPNTGDYSLTANDLSGISGSVAFNLIKYRMQTDIIQGKTYVTISEIIYQRAIIII